MNQQFFKDNETDEFMGTLFGKIYPDCSKEEVIEWLRSTPASTALRVHLGKVSREHFISNLRDILCRLQVLTS
jgi:hypothetical protein